MPRILCFIRMTSASYQNSAVAPLSIRTVPKSLGTWRNKIVLLQKKLHRFKKSLYHFFKGCVLVSAQILLIFFVPGENFRNPYPDKNFQLFPYRPILSLSLSLSLSNSLSLFLKKKKKGEGGRGNRPGT